MVDSKIDFNALCQAIDSTWGRSSTPKTSSYSVKFTIGNADDHGRLNVSFAAVVNFGTERQMIEMKRAYAEEAGTIISEVVKAVKARYKDLVGSTLKLKFVEGSERDSVEIINYNVHNAKRTAYYRRKLSFDVG